MTLVQRQTNTQPIIVDDYYKSMFLQYSQRDFSGGKTEELAVTFDKTIKKYQEIDIPTPYESIVHYPILVDILENLFLIGIKHDVFPSNFPKPLIGSADLAQIGAYAQTAYNTIVIDRGLFFFFSNMSRIIAELVMTYEGSDYIIKASVLTVEELVKRIQSNHSIVRDFAEIVAAYLKYGTVLPFSQHNALSSSTKAQFHEELTYAAMRFVVAHEMMHILYQHQDSSPQNESDADVMATQLCGLFVQDMAKESQLYWAPVYVTSVLDLLQQADTLLGFKTTTHPEKRAELTHYIATRMKVGGHALGMAQAVRRIMFLLWALTKDIVLDLAKNERITSPQMLKDVIAAIPFR